MTTTTTTTEAEAEAADPLEGFVEIDPATLIAAVTIEPDGEIRVTLECKDVDGNPHTLEAF